MSRRKEARAKGFWPIEIYEEYIENHASTTERRELLDPGGEPDTDFNNIVIANDSMAEWMSFKTIVSLNDRDLNFRNLVSIYRLETRQHIAAVQPWLDQIKRWAAGRALLAEIRSSRRRDVRIVPYRGTGRAAFESASNPVAATAKWRLVNPYKFGDVRAGKGTGSDSLIEFTPDAFKGRAMSRPGQAPDEVLYHELIHASRTMRGVVRQAFVNQDYDDHEEYLAIALANIYLSEKGQRVFRGDHYADANATRLKGWTRDNFLDNSQDVNLPPMQLMDDFKASQPNFYQALADLPPQRPKYNWVRQHNDRRKFQEFTGRRKRVDIF
ncbi:MAG: M91 family zinc metallopeptidase [Xanthobacteraceae bacterium]